MGIFGKQKKKEPPQTAEIWQKYEQGLDYGRITGRFNEAEKCFRFYEGDQWAGIKDTKEPLPFYNFIEPVIDFKRAKIAMNTKVITFSSQKEDPKGILDALNKKIKEAWEYAKMDDECWEAATYGLVEGNAFLYFYDGQFFSMEKELCRCLERENFVQILDGCKVILGDEEEKKLQNQPWIIIQERLPVDRVRAIARNNGISEKDAEGIRTDQRDDAEITTGTKTEQTNSNGFVTSLLYFERVEGTVRFCRVVKDLMYQKFQDLKMDYYPLVHLPINRQMGKARGIGEVRGMIPNQIEVNRTLVRRKHAVTISAYPKQIVNSFYVEDHQDLDAVGAKIMIRGDHTLNNVLQAVGYLQPAAISSDATVLQNELITTTKELAGAGDAALGNVNPEQASGAAIVAVQGQADIPLNRELAAFGQMVEDIAILWFHMFKANNAPSFRTEMKATVTAEEMDALCPSLRVDIVSPDAERAKFNNLYTLMTQGLIGFDELLALGEGSSDLPIEKLKALREEKKQKETNRMDQELAAIDAEQNRQTQEVELDSMMNEAGAGNAFAGMLGG